MHSLNSFDLEAFYTIHIGLHHWLLDYVFWAITCTGLGYVQVCGILSLTIWPKLRRYVTPLLGVWLISGLINTAIKHTVQRDRPSNLLIAHPQEGFYHNSFPSGHTVTSVAIAVMVLIWTWKSSYRWVGILMMIWAVLVGISRIYRGVHWPTDVLAAMVIGTLTSVVWHWVGTRISTRRHIES